MMAYPNRMLIYVSAIFIFLATVVAAYTQEFYWLFLPIAIPLLYILIQNPLWIFYSLLASIPWSIEFNFSQSLGTDLPDEPLMLLTSMAVVIMMIWRHKKITGKYVLHPVLVILFLMMIWVIITVITSTEPLLSVKYLLAKSWYLLAFVAAPLLLLDNKRKLTRAAMVLLCSMLACTFLLVFRHALNGWTFEKINDSLEPFFRNHVNYSALLVCMVPLQIAVIQLSNSKKLRLIFGITLVLTIGAVYFSYARGAWLALLTGISAYWLVRKRLLFTGFLLFIVLSIVVVFWLKSNDRFLKFSNDYKTTIFHTDFSEHLIATYQMKDVSTAERFYRWVAGVRMVKDSWKTGLGPTTFYNNYKSYTLPAFKTWVSNNPEHSTVHNYFLLLLIEQGLPGLLLFLVLIGALFRYAEVIYHRTHDPYWKAVVLAASSILVMECSVNFLSDLIETDKMGSVFYLCVAVMILADVSTRKSDSAAHVERVP